MDENKKDDKSISNVITLAITREQLEALLNFDRQPIEVDIPKPTDAEKPPPQLPCDNTGLNGTPWVYQYITEKEMAKKVKRSVKTLQNLRKQKLIQYHKIGRSIRYSPEDVKYFHNFTFISSKKNDKDQTE